MYYPAGTQTKRGYTQETFCDAVRNRRNDHDLRRVGTHDHHTPTTPGSSPRSQKCVHITSKDVPSLIASIPLFFFFRFLSDSAVHAVLAWEMASRATGRNVKEVPMTETSPVPITMLVLGILTCITWMIEVMPDTISAALMRYCVCSSPLFVPKSKKTNVRMRARGGGRGGVRCGEIL